MKSKAQLHQQYAAATSLHVTSPLAEWLAVFPDRDALITFEHDTGQTAWPEFYGQSPWDDAYSLAFECKHGVSQSSADFYRREAASLSPQTRAWAAAKYALLAAYRIKVPSVPLAPPPSDHDLSDPANWPRRTPATGPHEVTHETVCGVTHPFSRPIRCF